MTDGAAVPNINKFLPTGACIPSVYPCATLTTELQRRARRRTRTTRSRSERRRWTSNAVSRSCSSLSPSFRQSPTSLAQRSRHRRTKCIHIFSQKSIFEYIDSYKHVRDTPAPPDGFAPCPQTGCDKFFSKADFSVSEVMKRRVAAHITRLKEEKEANSGAGGTQRGKTGTQYHEIVDSDDDD